MTSFVKIWNNLVEITEDIDSNWLEIIEIDENKIEIIKNDFDKQISEYNSKYPEEEQKRFPEKIRAAEIVISWWFNSYIHSKAIFFWISDLEYALKIKEKSDLFEAFYIECENEKDLKIKNLIL